MIDFLCKLCDRSLMESESEYQYYRTTLRKKNDKSFYKNILLILSTWTNMMK